MSTWTKFLKNGYVGGNTTLEKMLNKTLLLFPSKNIDQNKTFLNHATLTTFSEQNLATRLNMTGKTLNRERKFGVGGFMNVHVDIGRWSMKCPFLST